MFAATRLIPDGVYIQRHNLDSVAVAIFRVGEQELTVVARHDFQGRVITHIEWSPDSKFLLFRDVDAAIGDVMSPKFRFEPPDIAVMEVKKGDKSEEVKVSLAKIMQQMPRVR